jgi:hypothetical protein
MSSRQAHQALTPGRAVLLRQPGSGLTELAVVVGAPGEGGLEAGRGLVGRAASSARRGGRGRAPTAVSAGWGRGGWGGARRGAAGAPGPGRRRWSGATS